MKINYQILALFLALAMGYVLFNRKGSLDPQEAVLETIAQRSSVRSYTDEPIDDETLTTLVKAGMAAPTAANMQPWEFVVIQGRDKVAAYADINVYAQMAKQAAAAIVVVGNMDVYKDRPEMQGYWPQDLSAATENILLAAEAMGLGAVWTGVYSEKTDYARERMERTSEWLGLPSNVLPFCVIMLGHPDGKTYPKDKWVPEKLHWGSYGE